MTTFDPQLYKTTTRRQWQEAAHAWHRWGPAIEDWLGEATTRMLDAAAITVGSKVLDVAAGAGGQTLAAARRAGPGGQVLATDIAPAILEYAQTAALAEGLANVSILEADGEDLDLPEGSFDAAISRVGLIYFPDQQTALTGMHRALRPGGRISAIVYSTADRNQFFSLPVAIIRKRAQLPPPAPGQPGPFSLGNPGAAEDALTQAGFTNVSVQTIPSPVRLPTAAECVKFERESFGALHQMLSGLSAAEQEHAWQEIASTLAQFEGPQGFVGPCEMLVVAGTK